MATLELRGDAESMLANELFGHEAARSRAPTGATAGCSSRPALGPRGLQRPHRGFELIPARRILLRLVSFGEGRPDTRRQQKVQALRSAADDQAEFSRVLRLLIDNRLVTVDGAEGTSDALADLSHEALITAWPALQEWIARRRADEQQRRWLEAKVGEWFERGRGVASLLDAVELSEAVKWMKSDTAQELGYSAGLSALVVASYALLDHLAILHQMDLM